MDRIKTHLSQEIEVQYVLHPKARKDGSYLIYVRFYIHHKTIRVAETTVSTGITTAKEKWTGESIRGTDFKTRSKNERLSHILTQIQDGLYELKRLNIKSVGAVRQEIEQALKVKITNRPPRGEKASYLSKITNHTLTVVKDNYLAEHPKVSETYMKNFRLAIQKFEQWWQAVIAPAIPYVSEVTDEDMINFKNWLADQKHIKHNTATTYLNRLRTIFNHAVRKKLIEESPINYRLIEGYRKGNQVSLTVNELIRFSNIPDEELSESLKKVKYIFLFLCSTGMGYGELRSLRLEHIQRYGNDLVITKNRNKTSEEFSVLLSQTAKNIYTQHLNPSFNSTVVCQSPFEKLYSIEYVTRKVKVLAKKARINKNLSTYVGRKTFATQWANDGNNIYYLQMILGHSKPETTMNYVNLDRSQMIEHSRKAFVNNPFHSLPI